MKISETTYTVSQYGSLKIPHEAISEMGLLPGDHVRVAFLSSDGIENDYCEFFLSADPMDELDRSKRIAIPAALLLQANIQPDSDIQIICVNGAIVLSQDPVLFSDDLKRGLSDLEIAEEILEQLPNNHVDASEMLRQFIENNEEGANQYEQDNE